jgi:hypothetical protein
MLKRAFMAGVLCLAAGSAMAGQADPAGGLRYASALPAEK